MNPGSLTAKQPLQTVDSHNLIIDLRSSPGTIPSKELRERFKQGANDICLDRAAILGAGPASLMTFRILFSVPGKTEVTRFCDTEQEALVWMRGEK